MRKPLVRKSMKNITKIENKSTTVLIQGIQERLSFEKSMTYKSFLISSFEVYIEELFL